MTELQFTRQFLHTLDSRPIKLSSDHVQDPRTLPAQPAYILPRNPTPYRSSTKPITTTSPSTTTNHPSTTQPQPQTLRITLKPLRGTPTTLLNVSLNSSIYDLKVRLGKRTGYEADKIKVLYGRKPVSDVKTVAEVVGEDVKDEAELGVMYVGQPTQTPVSEEADESATTATTATTAAGEVKDAEGDTPMTSVPDPPATSTPGPIEPRLPSILANHKSLALTVAFSDQGKATLASNTFWAELVDFTNEKVRDRELAFEAVGAFWRGYRGDQQLRTLR